VAARGGAGFYIEDALRHPWLQPVTDESMRAALSLAAPDSAIERRKARVSSAARRRLRVSVMKVMALRRLSEPGVSSDKLREALQQTEGIVAPTAAALQALEAQSGDGERRTVGQRRLSDASTVSYQSDQMGPRLL
jgi:hypothetical protein